MQRGGGGKNQMLSEAMGGGGLASMGGRRGVNQFKGRGGA